MADLHRRDGRKYDQTGDQKRAHHTHAEHDRDCRHECQDQMIEMAPHPGSAGKGFIKSHSKQGMIKENVQEDDDAARCQAEPYIRAAHRQDAAKHVIGHIRIHPSGERNGKNPHGQSTAAKKRRRRIPFDAHAFLQFQKKKSRCHRDGDGDHQRVKVKGIRYRQCRKAHMGQAVTDHGVPFEDKAGPQKRSTDRDQNTNHQRTHHEGILQQFQNKRHHRIPPCRMTSGCALRKSSV